MNLVQADEKQIIEIYENDMIKDFPESELKPLDRILETAKSGLCKIFSLMDQNDLKAYAVFIFPENGKHLLLDYFAVRKEYRGQGVGHQFFMTLLPFLKEKYPDIEGVFIESERVESECEDKQTKERRIAFYLDNGCMLTDLESSLFGVDFSILFFQTNGTNTVEYADLDYIYKAMFKPKHYAERVFIKKINKK